MSFLINRSFPLRPKSLDRCRLPMRLITPALCLLSSSAFVNASRGRNHDDGRPQYMPPSYRDKFPRASWSEYVQWVNFNKKHNASIPPVDHYTIRLMTYNIHYLRDREGETSTLTKVMDDVRAISPTIVAFQEVPEDGGKGPNDDPRIFEKFTVELRKLGYTHIEGDFTREHLGNFIASKIPIKRSRTRLTSRDRNVVEVKLEVCGRDFLLYNTHLEAESTRARVAEAHEIVKMTKEKEADCQILLGDMNSYINEQPMRHFDSHGLIDAFTLKGRPLYAPKVTCWAGTRIDFITLSPGLGDRISGAYVYYTTASDHLPVIVDLSSPCNIGNFLHDSINRRDRSRSPNVGASTSRRGRGRSPERHGSRKRTRY